jgi:uncharacterized peroxidase-related enzyme
MAFISLVADDEATGAAAELLAADRDAQGRVPELVRLFAHRPDVYEAWRRLLTAVKGGMDERRYELATLAAARRLRSSYCSLAHGEVLVQKFMDAGQVRDAAIDHRAAGLDEVDVAVMDLADRIAADATSVTQADVDRLRELGLGDQEIFGVALAASIRCFFSTALDAMGVQPDARFSEMPGDLRDALTVGRPIGPA